MNFEEYQNQARLTAVYPREHSITYPILGLNGEAGEVAEKWKKIIRDNLDYLHPDNYEALRKELGDVLWYLSNIASDLGMSLEAIAKSNLAKLEDRMSRNKLHGEGDER